ncbi:hypothetical protein RRG08_025331 [Elysia crispata]|uniref:Uncharacterized protein n=1 Tax=Elysia crispata TaxID=231223 RepID=A0AAE1A9X7_9GAST|nr:hypothetical protein RRG08_025331 [Elysia crispata]
MVRTLEVFKVPQRDEQATVLGTNMSVEVDPPSPSLYVVISPKGFLMDILRLSFSSLVISLLIGLSASRDDSPK